MLGIFILYPFLVCVLFFMYLFFHILLNTKLLDREEPAVLCWFSFTVQISHSMSSLIEPRGQKTTVGLKHLANS